MATLISTVYTRAEPWLSFDPGYAQCQALVGNTVGTGSDGVATAITNIAVRSPVLLACVITDDPEHIYVVYSPRKFIPDPLNANTYDNDVVCLCGNDLDTSYPIVLPSGQAFARIGNSPCHDIATITGPAGFGAGINCFGPHNDGDPNTDTI